MAESTPLQFDVPEIHGQGCINAITNAPRKLDPDANVTADFKTKRVLVGAQIDAGRAIEAAGFSVKAAG
jgi:copper chaperone